MQGTYTGSGQCRDRYIISLFPPPPLPPISPSPNKALMVFLWGRLSKHVFTCYIPIISGGGQCRIGIESPLFPPRPIHPSHRPLIILYGFSVELKAPCFTLLCAPSFLVGDSCSAWHSPPLESRNLVGKGGFSSVSTKKITN